MALLEMDRSRLAWWTLGFALAAAVLFVLHSFVGTFVFGLFLYYATRPIYRRIRTRIRPQSLAAAVALFVLALPALALVAYTGGVAVSELFRLTDEGLFDLSRYPFTAEQLSVLTDFEELLTIDPSVVTLQQVQRAVSSIGSAGDVVAFVGIGLVHLFAMIALAFYLLRDDRTFSRWFRTRIADDRGVMEAFLAGVDRDFNNIFFGNILNAVLTGTIAVVVYSLLNLIAPPQVAIPAAALAGLFAGVASLVPVVGMKLVYVPITVYLGVASSLSAPDTLWFAAVFFTVSFVVVDTIPDLVLRPYVSGRHLHVGAVMIAYTLGPLLFGWYGVFLGPIILVLVVNFARHVLPVLVAREPLVPYAVDPGVIAGEGTTEPDSEPPRTEAADTAAGRNRYDGFGFESPRFRSDRGGAEGTEE
jgi:predicted PurR-regulated permease PerM